MPLKLVKRLKKTALHLFQKGGYSKWQQSLGVKKSLEAVRVIILKSSKTFKTFSYGKQSLEALLFPGGPFFLQIYSPVANIQEFTVVSEKKFNNFCLLKCLFISMLLLLF